MLSLNNLLQQPDRHELHFASSGYDAKKILLQNRQVAVALLDVVMEQEDAGFQLVQFIREELDNPFLRVIMRTGHSGEIPEDQIFERYDINDFLAKVELTSSRLKITFKSALRSYMQLKELDKLKHVAEVANRTKSEFLANMSHELRSPMQAMFSFAAMGMGRFNVKGHEKMKREDFVQREKSVVGTIMALEGDALREKALSELIHGVPRYFFRIHDSTQRLMGLINNLLDLAKLESGKMDYDFRRQNLQPIAELQIAEIAPLLQEKNLRVELYTPLVKPEIECDGGKIMQVIRNLLSNALKFSPEGSHIQVRFALARAENAESGILIEVLDEGGGIPPSQLSSIFSPFEQSNLTKNGAGGTGLGLAICKEYVEAHKGKIWADNRPDGGAVFSIVLPDIQRANG